MPKPKPLKILTNKHKRLERLHITPIEQEKRIQSHKKRSIPPINVYKIRKNSEIVIVIIFINNKKRSSTLRKRATQAAITYSEQ